jgi:hypothetical protein
MLMDTSWMGGFWISMVNGLEHPPIGMFMFVGNVIVTGLLVTSILLFFVIV